MTKTIKQSYQALMLARQKEDGLPRAGADSTNIAKRHNPWIIFRSKMGNAGWRLALAQIHPGRDPLKQFRVDKRDPTLTIWKTWDALIRGKTQKCSYAKALIMAESQMNYLIEHKIENPTMLKTAGWFDRPWR